MVEAGLVVQEKNYLPELLVVSAQLVRREPLRCACEIGFAEQFEEDGLVGARGARAVVARDAARQRVAAGDAVVGHGLGAERVVVVVLDGRGALAGRTVRHTGVADYLLQRDGATVKGGRENAAVAAIVPEAGFAEKRVHCARENG